MKYLEFERMLYDQIPIKVPSIKHVPVVKYPTIVWLENLKHAIVIFPNKKIFNCNPRKYKIDRKSMLFGLGVKKGIKSCQVEPNLVAYEYYFNNSFEPFIENDLNCVLWSFYYLDWYIVNKNSKNSLFPRMLQDLEIWCTFKIWFQ